MSDEFGKDFKALEATERLLTADPRRQEAI